MTQADFYWIHNPVGAPKWITDLIPLAKSGKIGLSNHNLAEIKAAEAILDHVEEAAKAAALELTDDEIKTMEELASQMDLNVVCYWEKEMNDFSSRPALADKNADIASYDTIFLGFPIWWYMAPKIINTFLESYDFTRKKIILFATSGGSGFGKTVQELVSSCPGATIREGRLFNGNLSDDVIKKWVEVL